MKTMIRNAGKAALVAGAAAALWAPTLTLVGCASDEPGHTKTTTKTTVSTPNGKTTTTETHEKDTTINH